MDTPNLHQLPEALWYWQLMVLLPTQIGFHPSNFITASHYWDDICLAEFLNNDW